VTVDPAFPPVSGADLRNWQNALAASRLGPVRLASLIGPAQRAAPEGVEIAALSDLDPSAPIWGPDLTIHFPPETAALFRKMIDSFAPDAIVFESVAVAPLIDHAGKSALRILDFHNIEADLIWQERWQLRWYQVAARRRLWQRVNRLAQVERQALAKVERAWVCSTRERERLCSLISAAVDVRVVANGIPRSEDSPNELSERSTEARPTLVFVGHLSYGPNIEAARALIDLMPRLQKHFPRARLLMAGRNPDPQLLAHGRNDGIEIIANPSHPKLYLRQADLAVLPLYRGGGTRIKAIEAMAWGVPVVATSLAVDGLNLENGRHVRIAETDAEMIAQIVRLMSDPQLYTAQREAAFQYVHDNFGQTTIEAQVKAALTAAASSDTL